MPSVDVRSLSVADRYAYQAYYTLNDAGAQISTFVISSVRSLISSSSIEEVFGSQHSITTSVFHYVSSELAARQFGYNLLSVQIVNVELQDPHVKRASNAIMQAFYSRIAAQHVADSERARRVILAEARAEAERLAGVGLAQSRHALAGMMATLVELTDDLEQGDLRSGYTSELLRFAQFYTTLSTVSEANPDPTLIFPLGMDAISQLRRRVREVIEQDKFAHENVRDIYR
jgi:regulator of protease activity HflC (stomatin/prohibitin superfamily)